ncbi:MAG TPA: DNA mismatch repair endonuclease MutL [Vicinamibacterales bacterium]|nr:DNA mismatch repair endonuclease MutL [Vicinamibacterales bacterium]
MPRIRRLPPDLADQIAAGEVVERPASVVKELVENALDAGARRIAVTIDRGGKRLVRVEDDGIGMDPEDARLAVERHATSKIARAEDLAAITTLGFRGEALPAIASVSRFTLRTRARGAPAATEVRIAGGGSPEVRDAAGPEGTLVEVADLFYNLPARRKFLKSDVAEAAQISRLVTQLALAHPRVGFRLISAGRELLACPPARDLAERFFQIYGERPDLIEIRREAGDLRLAGFVAALAEQGPVRGPQHLYVNGRIVRDRVLAHAIADAYSAATIRERSPEVHLFLTVPPDRVDVNVHPTKAEVRFLEPSVIHEIVRRALADALGRAAAPELQLRPSPAPSAPPVEPLLPGLFGGRRAGAEVPLADLSATPAGDGAAPALDPADGPRTGGSADHLLGPWVPLGQFRETFIIAVDEEGVVIVDQHVAHERVLFERIMERLAQGRLEGQRLLVPRVIDLPPAARAALAEHAAALARLGFEIEPFGRSGVRLSGVPALLSALDGEAALRALAADLETLGRAAAIEEALRRLAATMACHAAVRANTPLGREQMQFILDELRRTAYSTVCPHGRPVVLRLSRREIERNFQRI